ncbi:DUF402 domain-containing protein [Deinococcus maricopensis]|uniref:DUF402 domain-containing protein n=1 Tax=Deinococcus maricopensis (strain DSM 21211 / LMG 22137 / NRRL B-23946 / LB-34) TaxID=709986 RepID=E8UAR2_DEIML|nr:DUF402 domain-containing protein [Deinococcus maricopensis]ADV68151.1 hypothetical protein Deima_2516 [Deinococcus maricopensis DSM 21211]
MHPVRVETLDLAALTHTLEGGAWAQPSTFPLAWAQRTPYGLHVGRAFLQHPTITFMERHVLLEFGLLVSRFSGLPGIPHSQYYVDVASVVPGERAWVTRDLYLDLIVRAEGTPVLHDTDEYLQAVEAGHLSRAEAAGALTAFHRAVNGVMRFGELERWLAAEGVQLTWRGAPATA